MFWLRPFDWNPAGLFIPIPIFSPGALPFIPFLRHTLWTASLRLHELDALLSASDVVVTLTAFAR
jgi:hypothetical protein